MRAASLRARMFFLVSLAVLPALGVIAFTAVEQRRDAISQAQQTALRVARLAAIDQGRHLASAGELLVALAQLREVRLRDTARCTALLAAVLDQFPLYLNLGAAKPDGELFCSARPVPEPINLADRPYFRRAMTSRGFAVGDYQLGRATRRASVNVGYPVFGEGGTIRGVVFAAIDLASLNQLVREARLPARSTLTVVDQQGTILVRHPDPERWVGTTHREAPDLAVVRARRTGVAEAADADGTPRLLGFAPLLNGGEAGDVYVSIGIPRDVALVGANRLLTRSAVTLALVGLLAFVAAWYGGEVFVISRIKRLVRATRRLAAGDLAARTGGPYAGEIGQLSRAFDEMAEAIRDREGEIRRSHEALATSEKLAAIGRLAAGVAHELRNPLTVIDARLQLLRMQLERGAPPALAMLSSFVTALSEASERMKHIMQGLSNYSRPARSEPTLLDVRELLSNVVGLVAYQARTSGVTTVLDVREDLPPVCGEPSEMMQILVNLATNAVEAMAGAGGTLTLSGRRELAGDREHVSIEVSDTGPGIPAARRERIWEPFYTTKADGTGLGLSIVRGLADKQPEAAITVESEVGVGTTFRLVMPAAYRLPPA